VSEDVVVVHGWAGVMEDMFTVQGAFYTNPKEPAKLITMVIRVTEIVVVECTDEVTVRVFFTPRHSHSYYAFVVPFYLQKEFVNSLITSRLKEFRVPHDQVVLAWTSYVSLMTSE
jgi:hypothetical protein